MEANKPGSKPTPPQKPQKPQEEKKSSNKGIIILLVVLLIGALGGAGYLYKELQDRESIIVEKVEVIEKQKSDIEQKKQELEDLLNKYTKLQEDFAALGIQNDSLKATIAELEQAKIELTNEKNRAWGAYSSVKKKIAQYEADYNKYKADYEAEKRRADSLQVKVEEFVVNLDKEKSKSDSLKQKVDLGSELKISRTVVTTLNDRGKEYDKEVHKGKKIDKVKIDYVIAANPIAPQENTVYVQIADPSGAVMFNESTGGGSFEDKDGNSVMYTMKKDLAYGNKAQEETIYYSQDPSNEWKEGTYKIKIFINGVQAASTAELKVK